MSKLESNESGEQLKTFSFNAEELHEILQCLKTCRNEVVNRSIYQRSYRKRAMLIYNLIRKIEH